MKKQDVKEALNKFVIGGETAITDEDSVEEFLDTLEDGDD